MLPLLALLRQAWAVALAMVCVSGALAAEPPKEEVARIRAVVQQQLQAFASDDAAKAFALADPGIRSKFDNAEHFMAMVREHYPMVHRPASVLFLKPESDGAMAWQRVRMTDGAGAAWLVTYLLQRQHDKAWRISACLVVPDAPRLST